MQEELHYKYQLHFFISNLIYQLYKNIILATVQFIEY